MKALVVIDQLHRRRLSALEAALKRARSDQSACEAALEERCVAEATTRERGLQLKCDIDAVLFTGTVKRPELNKAQHQLLAAKDALRRAQEAVQAAQADVAAAVLRTEEAVRAWREQAVTVEKFDAVLQRAREEKKTELLYREEMEQEDVFRKRA